MTMTGGLVRCRARVSRGCYHGREEREVYGSAMTDDGTWDGESVVCDVCYAGLLPLTPSGMGLAHELEEAIAEARRLLGTRM